MRFYRFTANYWLECDFDGDGKVAQGLIVAESYKDALEKLECRLEHLEDVYLQEWKGDTDFLFVEEEQVAALDKLLEECSQYE